MKTLTCLFFAAVMISTACSTQQSAPSAGPPADQNGTAAAASGEKQQYEEKIEAQLKELDREIANLKERAVKQSKATRKDLDQSLTELEVKREVLRVKLEKLRNESEAAWKDMKPGIEAAMDDLEAAYRRAASHFK
jgi:flagellar motility protein MotE (MotC chaperone)